MVYSPNIRRKLNVMLRKLDIQTQHTNTRTQQIADEVLDHIETLAKCSQCRVPHNQCCDKYGHDAYHFIRYKDIRRMFR